MHGGGKEAPSCQLIFPAPGTFASLGVGRALGCTGHHLLEPPCLGPAPAQPPGPIPSFWQLPGLGEPRPGMDDLTAVPLAPQGPVFLSLSGPILAAKWRACCPSVPEAHIAWPVPVLGKAFSTERLCASCIHGCLLVPPGPWTPSGREALPALPFLSDRSGHSLEDRYLEHQSKGEIVQVALKIGTLVKL